MNKGGFMTGTTSFIPTSLTRRCVLIAGTLGAGGFAARLAAVEAPAGGGISRSGESIHQEPVFDADRARLYAALTETKQFDKVVQLSSAMQGRASKPPTELSPNEGGAFALFGGYITGRQVQLKQNELIVQAWRSASWGPGLYSIARFQLKDHGAGSMILFDHVGFPNGEAQNLAAGWQANYWTPLAKLLSQ
jgi:activator of HSP90 ATPase